MTESTRAETGRRRSRPLAAGLVAALVVAAVAVTLALREDEVVATTTVPVNVFPVPDATSAAPESQISLRGAPARAIGEVRVTGSDSGNHGGKLRAHPDGRGASFVPDKPFKAGEEVTVETGLNVRHTREGDFRFTVAEEPATSGFGAASEDELTKGTGEVQAFRSRPDLQPPAVTIRTSEEGTARGRIFVAPKNGRGQDGPMILDDRGEVLWFQPMSGLSQATDFRVQRYQGRPVLTWWQGRLGFGQGRGEGMIVDRSYREVARVRAANGYSHDLHEFVLTPQGTALLTIYNPVPADLSSVGGSEDGIAIEGVIQEVDVETGLVLSEWHSLDHVPIEDSYYTVPPEDNRPWDYFHINSVSLDTDGNWLVSARHTFAVYKIDRTTGDVMWRLNGKRSDFAMSDGARFAWQHDARRASDGTLTLFDNAHTTSAPKPAQALTDGPGKERSRALALELDTERREATVARDFAHPDDLLSDTQANVDVLPNGNIFVGWGSERYFSEFDRSGRLVFDGRFANGNDNYRAYRARWRGMPRTKPRLAVDAGEDGAVQVHASWNGATEVARWTVLAGPSADRLRRVATAPRDGFETTIAARTREPLVAVRAISPDGRVLGTSEPVDSPSE